MGSEISKLLFRIKNTSDGKDFINYLLDLSHSNYKSWKLEGGEVLRGKAIMLDQLLDNFETCDANLIQKPEVIEWL